MKKIIIFFIAIFISINAFSLEMSSDVIKNKEYIPDRYTCDAQDFSPAIFWGEVSVKTKSFVLICDDPDAPYGIWVHWVLFNIPPDSTELKENISETELSSLGIIRGRNDFGELNYRGPCPPPGKAHSYFFKLYALNTTLSLEEGATKKEVIKEMQGHIISEKKIIGKYQR